MLISKTDRYNPVKNNNVKKVFLGVMSKDRKIDMISIVYE